MNLADDVVVRLCRPICFMTPERIVLSTWLGHVPFAYWLIEALSPKTLVELGVHNGGSYIAFLQAIRTLSIESSCYAVDTWAGDAQTGFYSEQVYQDLLHYHQPRYGTFSRLIRSRFDQARPHFADGTIDLLHIDGFHTYEAVAQDFRDWLPKMSDRGVILFHDINVREGDFGVWRLWEELREQYPSFEFLHSHGLGVLAVGREVPEPVRWLTQSIQSETVAQVRHFFGRLGDGVHKMLELDQDREEIAILKEKASHRENDIFNLQHRLEQKEHEFRTREAFHADNELKHHQESAHLRTEHEQALAAKDFVIQTRDVTIAALYASTSWRLTSPLRALVQRLKGQAAAPPPAAESSPAERLAALLPPDETRTLEPRLDPYQELDNVGRAQEVNAAPSFRQRRQAGSLGGETGRGLSVIILTKDHPELILPLLEDLIAIRSDFTARGLGFEILVGDTGTTDGNVWRFYETHQDQITVIRDLKYHFSACNNQVFYDYSRFDSVLFLNNDIVLKERPGCLMTMYDHLQARPELGVVGLCLLFPDGTIQHAGIDVFREGSLRGFCYHPRARQPLPAGTPDSWSCLAVTGACLMIRAPLFEAIGGFDEGYRTECQDVALCLAARRHGAEIDILNLGHIIHLENATRPKGSEDWADRQRFMRRWGSYLEATVL